MLFKSYVPPYLKSTCPHLICNYDLTSTTVRVASGTAISTCGSFTAIFKIGNESFSEPLLIILRSMNQTISGLPFFERNENVIRPKFCTLKLPHNTLQLTERIHKDGKISASTQKKNLFLKTHQSSTIKPSSTETILVSLFPKSRYISRRYSSNGCSKFEKRTGRCVTSAIVKLARMIKYLLESIMSCLIKSLFLKKRQMRVWPFSMKNKRITYNQ